VISPSLLALATLGGMTQMGSFPLAKASKESDFMLRFTGVIMSIMALNFANMKSILTLATLVRATKKMILFL
jgi:hypothetical protein